MAHPQPRRAPEFTEGVTTGLQGGAILGEVFRSGIEAIDRGQREASLALGASRMQTIMRIVVPASLSGIMSAVLLVVSLAAILAVYGSTAHAPARR